MNGTLFLLAGAGILAVGVTLGMIVMRLKLTPEIQVLQKKIRVLGRQEEEWSATVLKTQEETKNLSSFLVLLPDLARRLNSHLEKRNIGPLLANTLEHIFDPSRILIYFGRKDEKQLYLAYTKGVPDSVPLGLKVAFTDGMTGWVADNLQVMDKDDFHGQSTGARRGALLGRAAGYRGEIHPPYRRTHRRPRRHAVDQSRTGRHHPGARSLCRLRNSICCWYEMLF